MRAWAKAVCGLGLGAAIALAGGSRTEAAPIQTGTIVVDARANIFAAGQNSTAGTGAAGPGVLPIAISIPDSTPPNANAVLTLTFPRVLGEVTPTSSAADLRGPDGAVGAPSLNSSEATNLFGTTGVSGIFSRNSMFLTGVFLGDQGPVGPAPPRLAFDNNNFGDPNFIQQDFFQKLAPELGQTFFVGNGRTSFGSTQQFVIPNGAETLYLGFADGIGYFGALGNYDDNRGLIEVNYSLEFIVVPEPASVLAWSAALLASAAWGVRRRRAASERIRLG